MPIPSPSRPLLSLLAHRGYWRGSASAQLVRVLPLMAPLAFVLVGADVAHSQAVGGVMVTVYIMSEVLFAPLAGRLLDRVGPARGTPRMLGVAAIALCGLAVAVTLRAPALVLFLLAALAAGLAAGAPGALRTLLSQAVPPHLLVPALAIDSTVIEGVVVTAPLLVAATAAPATAGAIIAMAAATAAAAFLVRGLRRAAGVPTSEEPAGATTPARAQPLWRNRRFIFWMIVGVAFGHALGTAETGALPLARHFGGGTREAAALIAALAVSSAVSGIVYAGVAHRIALEPTRQARILLALLVVGAVGLGRASSWVTAAGAMAVLGLATAPLGTVRSQAAEADAPPERKAEAFGMLYAATGVGYALGGVFLALLPLDDMLMVGAVSAVIALLVAPALGRHRVSRSSTARP